MNQPQDLYTGDILIVDDDPAAQNLLTAILTRAGNTVRTASDAVEALEACIEELPETILLDLQMPGINGLDLCPIIRDKFGDIPIIMVTGANDQRTSSKIMSNGANRHLIKPLNSSEVLTEVKGALQVRHLQLQLEAQKDRQKHVQQKLDAVNDRVLQMDVSNGEVARREFLTEMAGLYEENDLPDPIELLG